jgi:hypothetical protein
MPAMRDQLAVPNRYTAPRECRGLSDLKKPPVGPKRITEALMDFTVGQIGRTTSAADRKGGPGAPVEARVLHVRAPRRTRKAPPPDSRDTRRSGSTPADPPGAQVLVLLVPDAHRLPADLNEGNYRIFLRFVRS